jgi:hypothetical protein
MKAYRVELDDIDVICAFKEVEKKIIHTDAPTEQELIWIRRELPVSPPEIISLHWLRNVVVKLRKGGKLK